eukprot:gene1103-1400_t
MEHVFSHYEQDFQDLSNTISVKLNRLSSQSLTRDENLVIISQIEHDIEEAQEIIQQLEFSAQNSGQISEIRPKISQFNSTIQQYCKQLENQTGIKTEPKKQNKVTFSDVNIHVKEDIDNFVDEEDLDDLREIKSRNYSTKEKFMRWLKRHSIKVIVITILSLTLALIAFYVFTKKNKNNPEKPVH